MDNNVSAYLDISRKLYFSSQEFAYNRHGYDERKMYHLQDAIYNQNCEIIRLLTIISKNTEELHNAD
jgi:hypothetical protein